LAALSVVLRNNKRDWQHGGMSSALGNALADGLFAVTTEISPPKDASPEVVIRLASEVRGWAHAVNITDNPGGKVRMSSLAGSVLAMRAGAEPVMQLTCRDRNRLALQSDLLAASALGVPNVLLMTGDQPSEGATPVFDLDGMKLIAAARAMRDQAVLMSGQEMPQPPSWLIGTVENPFGGAPEVRAQRLADKVAAGAEFAQTQYVFDIDAFAIWMDRVRDLGLTGQCGVLAGVGPLRSPRMLEFLRTEVPGVDVPDDVVRRLRGVPPDRFAREGEDLCVETIRRLREIPGVAGIHLMAPATVAGGIAERAVRRVS
jgi:methylenetetrahydrofolate reductase (NADPH)